MSLGRRKVTLEERSRWVFNRMADVYDARPPYPAALIDAIAERARVAADRFDAGQAKRAAARILDVGAGTGHLALPLAARGFDVVAIEPAALMLQRMEAAAAGQGIAVRGFHASAESVPIADGLVDLAVIADALHFLDADLTGRELARVLSRHGGLAVVTCELGDTPFMRQVVEVIHHAVPRRPRRLDRQIVQLCSLARVSLEGELTVVDHTSVDHATLDRILRSISFIGPAMNADRTARFRERVLALTQSPVWSRSFVLRWGMRPGPRPQRTRKPASAAAEQACAMPRTT